jgi:hypothetical protein
LVFDSAEGLGVAGRDAYVGDVVDEDDEDEAGVGVGVGVDVGRMIGVELGGRQLSML